MEQIHHRGIAAGVAAAVVWAGGVAAAPPTMPALPTVHLQEIDVQLTDLFSALSTNSQYIVAELGNALTAFTQLHLSTALGDLFSSAWNAANIPQNLLTAVLATLTGDSSPSFLIFPQALPLSPDELGALFADLTSIQSEISTGVTNLSSLDLVDALSASALAFDDAVFAIPAELIGGPLLALGF